MIIRAAQPNLQVTRLRQEVSGAIFFDWFGYEQRAFRDENTERLKQSLGSRIQGNCQVKIPRYLLYWVLVLLITACSSPPTASPSPTDAQRGSPSEFEGTVDVGGYEMYLHCMGTGTPTVILEAGLNDVAETWSLVQPGVARFTRACAYDRVGLGWSDPGHEPRDSFQIVRELHTLLINAGIKWPFVVVGHSLGGMYMRLFADYYQKDVVGLVLVDSAHIDDPGRCAAVLPTESPNESESLRFYRDWLANPPTYPELPHRLFEPGSLGDMPLVVITSPHKVRESDLPAGLSEKWDEIFVELQNEWAQISSRSTHIMAYESGHFIQQDQPDLVIDAILQVVEEALRARQ